MRRYLAILLTISFSVCSGADEIRHKEIKKLFQEADHKPAFEKYERLITNKTPAIGCLDERKKSKKLAKLYEICMLIDPSGTVVESHVMPIDDYNNSLPIDEYGECLNRENKKIKYKPQNLQKKLPMCVGEVIRI